MPGKARLCRKRSLLHAPLFIDPRRRPLSSRTVSEQTSLSAVKVAIAATDIVSGNASLLVGGSRQRNQRFLPGYKMGDLYGIATA